MDWTERIAALLPEGVRLDRSDDVLAGQRGWLFERDGGRKVLAQMRGDLILAPKAALRWQFVLESRVAWLKRRDVAYLFAIAPDAYAVMTDELPDAVAVSPRRPAIQVLRQLERGASYARALYPLEELTAEHERRAVFTSHDSRWNPNAAFVAYERIVGELEGAVELRRLGRDHIRFTRCLAHGDLGHRLDPPQQRNALVARPHRQAARLLFDNRVAGEGRTLITRCDDAPATTCLFIGDRAAYRMLPYLSETFGRMVFVHRSVLDHELVESERPDVVVTLADESAMLESPADVEAPSTRALAEHKLAAGAAMPTLAPLWGQEAAETAPSAGAAV